MSDLRDLVPPSVLTPSFRRDEFERRLIVFYTHHKGKPDHIVRLLYLQYVRQVTPTPRGRARAPTRPATITHHDDHYRTS
jgi:hypothetical protein